MNRKENLKNDHYGLYYGDARYEKVWEQMKLLGIQDVSTKRQDKNGTIVWKLPIKNQWNNGKLIEVASFSTGYVRNQNSCYCNYQLNKCKKAEEYWLRMIKEVQQKIDAFTTKKALNQSKKYR